MIETQFAQVAAAISVAEIGKIPGQPESPVETANMVSTGWGNLPRQTPRTNHAGRYNPPKNDTWDGLVAAIQEDPGVPMINCSILRETPIPRSLPNIYVCAARRLYNPVSQGG